MKKIFIISLVALVASCADYNVTDDFRADPDPTYVEPYKDLDPVKFYIDRNQYPNLTLGATLKVSVHRQCQGRDELPRHERSSQPCGRNRL